MNRTLVTSFGTEHPSPVYSNTTSSADVSLLFVSISFSFIVPPVSRYTLSVDSVDGSADGWRGVFLVICCALDFRFELADVRGGEPTQQVDTTSVQENLT